jgi:hypothetical protein
VQELHVDTLRLAMRFILLAALFVLSNGWAAEPPLPASAVPKTEMPDFSPPPVPEFMLHPPKKPLTLEEMKKQADDAARSAR